VIVLPTDDKYIGCRVTLFNSNYIVTRIEAVWGTPVIAENGYFTHSDSSLTRGCSEIEFRGGTIELMLLKTKESDFGGSTKVWAILNSNCTDLTYHEQVE
jgi:hypothetical protein